MPSLPAALRPSLSRLKTRLEHHHPRLLAGLLDLAVRLAPGRGEPELALVDRLCGPGSRAIDVGANHGDYTSRLLRAGALVVAVEPNPRMVAVLRHRFAAAVRRGRLTIEACALAERPGSATLHIPRGGAALGSLRRLSDGEEETIEVPCRTLDALAGGAADFVKIDVEGFEGEVVAGAVETLRRDRPALLIEAEERHRKGALAGLRAMLEPLGYEGFYLLDGGLHPLGAFDPALLQSLDALTPDGLRRLPGGTYVNNFLFLARPEQRAALAPLIAGVEEAVSQEAAS